MTRESQKHRIKILIDSGSETTDRIDFSKLLEPFREQLQSLTEGLLQDFANNFQIAIHKQFEPIFTVWERSLDNLRTEIKLIAPTLKQAQLWMTPSASLSLFQELQELRITGRTTPEDVQKTFISHYKHKEYKLLRETISTWKKHPLFEKRMAIIDDAFDVHKQGKYTLSIPALLPLVEGITREALGQNLKHMIPAFTDLVGRYGETDFTDLVFIDILLLLIKDPLLYGEIPDDYFDPVKFAKWIEEQGIEQHAYLNRHAIMHGVQTQYATEINSLRAFLLLDGLFGLLHKDYYI
jgi:hypothetical protein